MPSDEKRERFSKLFDKHYKSLFNYAVKSIKEEDVAQEIIQETFIKLWENFEKIDMVDRSIQSYLIVTLKNKIIDFYRKTQTRKRHIDLYAFNKDEYVGIDNLWELSDRIDSIYTTLPKKTTEIFKLSREKGLTYKEIATYKNISVKTVELHVSRALDVFRSAFQDYT